MADDDLDMLQQLLEMAEDDKDDEASEGRAERETFMSGPPDQENFPANKRPKLAETAKPLAAGKSRSATKCAFKSTIMESTEIIDSRALQPSSRLGGNLQVQSTAMHTCQLHRQRPVQLRNSQACG